MEFYALCKRPIESTHMLQKSINVLGFDLRILSQRSIDQGSGYLPAEWKAQEAGFEIFPFPPNELIETYPETDFEGVWPRVYASSFGTLAGCVGASIAAAALAWATDGIVFDPQDEALMASDDAAPLAAENEVHFTRIGLAIR